LRGLVSKAFTPRYIEALRPKIQQIADELLDQVQAQGTMDLVRDYAYPLPINVISDMLGVPPTRREDIRQWSASMASGGARGDLRAFAAYIMQLVADKRRQPQDDLISNLIRLETADDALDEQELLSMVGLLIFAGHETTSNLISIGLLTLFDHPAVFDQIKADLSLVPAAVEELLRLNGPVLMPAPRFALEAVDLGGVTVNRGDMLLIALGSANHDEAVFNNPEELNIARDLSRHIAFGQGIHFCLGAPLARLEGEIAFATLLQRLPNLRLNAPRNSITWRGSVNLRGLTALPVAF
jgi:cytochrome P450